MFLHSDSHSLMHQILHGCLRSCSRPERRAAGTPAGVSWWRGWGSGQRPAAARVGRRGQVDAVLLAGFWAPVSPL